jgi:hypothetical protein
LAIAFRQEGRIVNGRDVSRGLAPDVPTHESKQKAIAMLAPDIATTRSKKFR